MASQANDAPYTPQVRNVSSEEAEAVAVASAGNADPGVDQDTLDRLDEAFTDLCRLLRQFRPSNAAEATHSFVILPSYGGRFAAAPESMKEFQNTAEGESETEVWGFENYSTFARTAQPAYIPIRADKKRFPTDNASLLMLVSHGFRYAIETRETEEQNVRTLDRAWEALSRLAPKLRKRQRESSEERARLKFMAESVVRESRRALDRIADEHDLF